MKKEKKLKILILLKKWSGGVGRANTSLAKALRKKGHHVDLFSREEDFKIYRFFDSIFPMRSKIKSLMKKENYDIIYTQDWSIAFPLLFPYPLFRGRHFTCFCGIERGFPGNFLQKTSGIFNRRKLVVIGDQLKKMFPKATLIYRGVDLREFRPLHKKRKYIGWIKRDWEEISEKEFLDLSRRLDLKPLIAEGIPPGKMNDFYNKCNIFISLPTTAGYNNCWNEAMAAGVPILVGNYRGAGTFLPISKIQNREKSIERILSIIKNSKKKEHRKWLIDKGFSWENKAEELIKFFRKNLKKNV